MRRIQGLSYTYSHIHVLLAPYIKYIYGIFGRETSKYTVIYNVCIRFRPTLDSLHTNPLLHKLPPSFFSTTTEAGPVFYTTAISVLAQSVTCQLTSAQASPSPFVLNHGAQSRVKRRYRDRWHPRWWCKRRPRKCCSCRWWKQGRGQHPLC